MHCAYGSEGTACREGGRREGNTYSSDFPAHPNDLHSHCPHHRPRSLECSACWCTWTGPQYRTGSLHQTHRSVTRTSFLVLDNDAAKHTEPTHASATCTHKSKLSENTASNFQGMHASSTKYVSRAEIYSHHNDPILNPKRRLKFNSLQSEGSSELSPQSLSWSHLNRAEMQIPFSHWNWWGWQVRGGHVCCSSSPSWQLRMPSHTLVMSMQG